MKQIIVTGASRKAYWYSNRIGEVFDVVSQDEDDYYVNAGRDGKPWPIYIQDAKPYEETEEQKEARAIDTGQPWPPDPELSPSDF